jgi:hypothetical protein
MPVQRLPAFTFRKVCSAYRLRSIRKAEFRLGERTSNHRPPSAQTFRDFREAQVGRYGRARSNAGIAANARYPKRQKPFNSGSLISKALAPDSSFGMVSQQVTHEHGKATIARHCDYLAFGIAKLRQ